MSAAGEMVQRYWEVCRGVNDRLADWLDRRGELADLESRRRWCRESDWQREWCAEYWHKAREALAATPTSMEGERE